MKLSAVVIKEKAKDIGFDLVGITEAHPFKDACNYLRKRKKEDSLPSLLTDDIQLLTVPGRHLQGVRSIISLALSYAGPEVEHNGFKMSSYTAGKDYHGIMQDKMVSLITELKSIAGRARFKSGVDTIPLLEREIARRAGLGWIGKNTTLINKQYGSYLFLGEILTDIELEPDRPIKEKCGECRLCIQNCPGSALKEPYYLDTQSCISSITQKKGVLTIRESNLMDLNFWGCDRCQQVCPYNQDIPRNLHSQFKPRIKPDVEKVLNIKKDSVPRNWQNAALFWRGLRILKRNALIVMGNSREEKYLMKVKKFRNSSSPVLKKHAERAYNKIKTGGYAID